MRRFSLGIPGDVPRRCRAGLLSGLAPARGDQKRPMPREPWDPRAVSHPRLLAVEFPALVFKEASSSATE